MIAVKMPAELEERLTRLANLTARTKTYYVREALGEHLDDIEMPIWPKGPLKRFAPASRALSAWTIELTSRAEKQLRKFDKQITRRILAFLKRRSNRIPNRSGNT